jgi:hypothetical protein
MSLKLLLLRSGETLISDTKEMFTEDKETGDRNVHGYLLNNPYVVTSQNPVYLCEEKTNTKLTDNVHVSMTSWILLSDQKEIPIPTDWVVTIVDPVNSLKNLYEENINGKSSEVSTFES